MNCNSVQNLLSAYLDHELTGGEMARVRRHLSECRCCDEEAAELHRLKNLLTCTPVVEPPPGFEERLLRSVLEPEKSAAANWRESWPLVTGVGLAAAALTLLTLTYSGASTDPSGRVEDAMAAEVRRDQAALLGSDPFAGSPVVIPVSYDGK